MSQGSNYTLRYCGRCKQNKKESQFRYIRHFNKFRRICKRCESLLRQTRKRSIEKHVQEHGVTPGILERIQKETNRDAERQSKILVLNNLSRFNRIKYLVSKVLLWPLYFMLYPLTIMTLLSVWTAISKGLSDSIVEVSAIFAMTAGMTAFLYLPVRSINRDISSQRAIIGSRLFREALRKRIEYEKFYRSPEWRILRQTFLRTRKQTGGRYICDFCGNPIWFQRDVTVDHRKPRWKFPELAMNIENLLLACRRCNSSKGGKLLSDEEFNLLLAQNKEINA